MNDNDPQQFAEWMLEHRSGGFHAELSAKLADLHRACWDTQKRGTLTVKITVTPNGNQFSYVDDVKVSAPEAGKPLSLFFFDEDTGEVSRNDPRQMEIDGLRRIPRHRDQEAV